MVDRQGRCNWLICYQRDRQLRLASAGGHGHKHFTPPGFEGGLDGAEARAALADACRFLEERLGAPWAMGDDFTLADCSAAPALFYADTVQPLGPDIPRLAAYLDRLRARPSFARVLKEASPYFTMFPLDPKPRI